MSAEQVVNEVRQDGDVLDLIPQAEAHSFDVGLPISLTNVADGAEHFDPAFEGWGWIIVDWSKISLEDFTGIEGVAAESAIVDWMAGLDFWDEASITIGLDNGVVGTRGGPGEHVVTTHHDCELPAMEPGFSTSFEEHGEVGKGVGDGGVWCAGCKTCFKLGGKAAARSITLG